MKWVAIVTRTDARIFNDSNFQLVAHLRSELGRLRNRAMSYGKPGFSHGKFGGSTRHYNLTNEKNPHEDAADQFAREIAEFLRIQKNMSRFDELLVVAEPKMKGRLRLHFDKRLFGISHFYGTDLGRLGNEAVRRVLVKSGMVSPWNPRVTA